MTTETNDGGSAFPFAPSYTGNIDMQAKGMSLRDWFAGQALAGFMAGYFANPESSGFGNEDIARSVYDQADAMLAARVAK